MQTLRGAHQSVNSLESVRILELDLGDRGASAGIVVDLLDNTLDVAVSLGIVLSLVGDGALTSSGMGSENRSLSATATSNNLSHL